MGFIERLRQEKETEVLARSQREAELGRKRETEDAARQQRETQEREFHTQRKQQAKNFRQASGVGSLAVELNKLLLYPTYVLPKVTLNPDSPDVVTRCDPDSTLDIVQLETRSDGQVTKPKPNYGGLGSPYQTYDKLFVKYFAIETCPDGLIVFHAGWRGKSSLPEAKWRNNGNILEEALEKAYTHPRDLKVLRWVNHSPQLSD